MFPSRRSRIPTKLVCHLFYVLKYHDLSKLRKLILIISFLDGGSRTPSNANWQDLWHPESEDKRESSRYTNARLILSCGVCYKAIPALKYDSKMLVKTEYFLNGPTPALFHIFKSNDTIFTKIMWKMSIQYTTPGLELMTIWIWVASLNHKAWAPAQGRSS